MERETLSAREVADTLGFGIRRFYQLANEGAFPFMVRMGSRWLIPRRAFEQFLENPNAMIQATVFREAGAYSGDGGCGGGRESATETEAPSGANH